MMRYLHALMITFSLLGLTAGNCQPVENVWQFYKDLQSVEFQRTAANPCIDVMGSPYENDEFTNGTVFTRKGVTYVDVPLRYNIYADEMEFLTEDENVMYLSPEVTVEFAMIGGRKYIHIPFIRGKQRSRGYFRVLLEGQASLLVKNHIKYNPAEKAQAFRDPQPPGFTRSPDEYFVRVMGRDALRISNRREMSAVFSDKISEMNNYVRENRISFRRADDLIALVEYYNSVHGSNDQSYFNSILKRGKCFPAWYCRLNGFDIR